MGRYCAECGDYTSCSQFSRNQWRKGDGFSRCRDCVDPPPVFQCEVCNRGFDSENELRMHRQVHRARDVACPVCGDRRFRSGANAVQHVESGYCRGCGGRENARRQIYDFARSKRSMSRYVVEPPRIEYYDYYSDSDDSIPEFPYHCPECCVSYRNLSQLLQHRDNKHNNRLLLTR